MTVVGGSVRAGGEFAEVSGGEFCRLPQPGELFSRRAARFEFLGRDRPMVGELRFLAEHGRAQQSAVGLRSGFASPTREHLERCREHGMPPLRPLTATSEAGWRPTLDCILDGLASAELPPATVVAI